MSESVVLEKSKANTQTHIFFFFFFYTAVKAKELCELSQTCFLASRAVAVSKHSSDGLNTLLMSLSKCWRAAQCLLSVPLSSSCLLNTAQIPLGAAVPALFGRDKKPHPLKPVTWKIQSPLCLLELAREKISPIWEPGGGIRTAVNTKSPWRDLL